MVNKTCLGVQRTDPVSIVKINLFFLNRAEETNLIHLIFYLFFECLSFLHSRAELHKHNHYLFRII